MPNFCKNLLKSFDCLKIQFLFFILIFPKGSDPLAGESETDYVARQRKLQDEVREREGERERERGRESWR